MCVNRSLKYLKLTANVLSILLCTNVTSNTRQNINNIYVVEVEIGNHRK